LASGRLSSRKNRETINQKREGWVEWGGKQRKVRSGQSMSLQNFLVFGGQKLGVAEEQKKGCISGEGNRKQKWV